jgi:tripeptidyl-peptidase I
MRSLSLFGSLLWASIASGAILKTPQVFEQIHSVPEGWEAVGEPSPNAPLKFSIALTAVRLVSETTQLLTAQADPRALERTLYDVSTPSSPNYGKYLTKEESEALMKPSPASREVVANWLQSSGVKDIRHDDEWVHFRATASQADSLMSTKFLVYRHVEEQLSEGAIRTTKVLLPKEIQPHIKMIHPTTRFGMMKPQRSVIYKISDIVAKDGECTNFVNPACLRALYKLPAENKFNAEKTGLLGVAGFLTQYARFNDLTKFVKAQAPWANGANFTYSLFNGTYMDKQRLILTPL